MFTRDELGSIIYACEAADRTERIVKILGLDVPQQQRAYILALHAKVITLAKEMDEKEAAEKKKAASKKS